MAYLSGYKPESALFAGLVARVSISDETRESATALNSQSVLHQTTLP